MINRPTHVKFEAKIPYGSKVVAFTRNYLIFLSFKDNSLSVNAKFLKRQFKSLKQIFYKFEGQFERQGQGHKFLKY